jgi:hypothetical protein
VGVYFHTDTTQLTFRELWRISSRLPVFLRACVNKVFGLRAPARWAVLHEEAMNVLPAEELPDDCLRALQPLIQEFEHLGAQVAFYHTTPALGSLEGHGAVLLPAERNAVIVLAWAKAQITRPGKETSVCAITSQLEDGTYLSTSNRPPRFHKPPEFRVQRCRGATPTELAQRHQQALAAAASFAVPVHDGAQAKTLLAAAKRRNYEWQVGRGVWVPLSPEELGRLGTPVVEGF